MVVLLYLNHEDFNAETFFFWKLMTLENMQILEHAERIQNEAILLTHFSSRYKIEVTTQLGFCFVKTYVYTSYIFELFIDYIFLLGSHLYMIQHLSFKPYHYGWARGWKMH